MQTCNIMGVNIAVTDMDKTLRLVEDNCEAWRGKYICVANVHTTVTAHDDPTYLRVQNGAVGGKFPAGKRGIAKAVAKGVERFFLHKTVGAALHGVILKGRQMVLRTVKCDGQPSAEVRKAKNQLCKRQPPSAPG